MKKSMFIRIGCAVVSIQLLLSSSAFAQNRVSKDRQAAILKDVCEKLAKYYTFPEIGEKSALGIMKKFENGGYSENATPEEFTEALNKDLFEISRDKHLKLIYDPEGAKAMSEGETKGEAPDAEAKSDRWRNFGFKELKILDGNIGYLNLSDFCSVKYAGAKAVAAMDFFSDCRSMIIDLRQNGGGSDDMVVFLASYFIDSVEPIVFRISYSTIDGTYYTSMLPAYVPGKRLTHVPIYLLTSRATASAAEAFACILKNYNQNVVIVGRKTRGAENPVSHLPVGDEYILRIPSWRKIYSSLKTTWEGTGLSPDIDVEEGKALFTAHLEGLKKLSASTTDEAELSHYRWAYDGVKAIHDPVSIKKSILKSYAGIYSDKKILYEKGELYYDRDRLRLIPISENYFLVESIDYFRIKFIKENGHADAFERIFIYGYSSRHTRK